MIEHAFGETQPLTLGAEEELMILDATSLDQVGAVDALLDAASGRPLPGALKTELFASIVELNAGVCGDVRSCADALAGLRAAAREAAAARGLVLAAAATHPFARPEAQPVVDEERYTSFVDYAGISARRQGVQGLHVHVGMPSGEACWRVLEGMLPWLPLLLALSANSPWLSGEATGFASNRAPILAELPRAGAPPPLGSYAGWETWVERLVGMGVTADYTRIWWDVRPHPAFGTLEVRVPDQPTDVRLSAAFAALLQALCAAALADDLPRNGALLGDRGRGDYAQNRWAAARFGPRAELLHPDGRRVASAAAVGAELVERVRPHADALGGRRLLDAVEPARCEADRQLEFETAAEATADLVARTLE